MSITASGKRTKATIRMVVGLALLLFGCALAGAPKVGATPPPAPYVLRTIPVGNGPDAISSDGTHVWVANGTDGTVTEIDAATGTVIGTPIPVGSGPAAISSDGKDVWVADNPISNALAGPPQTVTEINAAGAVVGSISVLSHPRGISSDGTHVWVANWYPEDVVTELKAPSGTLVGSTGAGPALNVSSDGTYVWVSDSAGGVLKIDASTGAVVGPSIPTGGVQPWGISSDGKDVWVANSDSNTVTKIDAATATVVGSPIPVGAEPIGISSDGSHVWVANDGVGDNTVTEIDAATRTVTDSIPVGTRPVAISSDGTHVWVANSGSNNVSEIVIPRVPAAPAAPSVRPQLRKATVSWTAPSDDGGFPIWFYTVDVAPGGASCTTPTGSVTSCNVAGLTAGGSYTFEVTATNAVGTSLASPPSTVVVPTVPISGQVAPFGYQSATLSEQLKTEIRGMARQIKRLEADGYNTVTLVGHTDPPARARAAQPNLGRQRAEAVKRYLVTQLSGLGVTGITIVAVGQGSATKFRDEGQVLNRRVDAILS